MTPEQPHGEADELIDRHVDGELSAEEFSQFKEALRNDAGFRDRYLDAVKLDTLLREAAGKADVAVQRESRPVLVPVFVWGGLGLAACLMILLAFQSRFTGGGISAEIGAVTKARWLDHGFYQGEELRAGDSVRIATGSVEVRFRSGAVTRVHGPCWFEVTSDNAGFLHHGSALTRADTPESKGFVLRTPSGVFVDRGTEFFTTAMTNGYSQMKVNSGAVDADIEGFARQRFEKGSGIGIEPGEARILIRIESGNGTPEFAFPSIPPPSASDAADRTIGKASIRLISVDGRRPDNQPNKWSGSPELLIDGRGQSDQDKPGESVYLPNGAEGGMLVDLGGRVPVFRVHTYSWHLNERHTEERSRAVQRYTLWGCGDKLPEEFPTQEAANGWKRIARVDTDAFFGVEQEPDRPAQQACAIYSSQKGLGRYRYLFFEVLPTSMPDGQRSRHTFYGEIDVFTPRTP